MKITDDVKAVSSGVEVCLILKNDNTVWATGTNGIGEFGVPTITVIKPDAGVWRRTRMIAPARVSCAGKQIFKSTAVMSPPTGKIFTAKA